MAGSLVESLSADFDPSAFTDEYREAVLALLARRLEGEDVIMPAAVAADDSGTVVDLMAALQESVRRTQAARAAAPDGTEEEQSPATAPSAPRSRATKPAAAKATKRSTPRRTGT
jgi:DNA end-binding protein Ku